MKRVLIFSGTTEGRRLAEMLADTGVDIIVCVATEYGGQVMGHKAGIKLHIGRLDRDEMREYMRTEGVFMVIDATHPFATEVSENIRCCCGELGIICYRLKRDTQAGIDGTDKIKYFPGNEECAEALLKTEGNILLTTGSKDLSVYCKNEALRNRLYVRVIPTEESIALCREQGIPGRQIIAMQGPFSADLNRGIICQYDIKVLVSKESGITGGFDEKAEASCQTDILMYVISNPETGGGMTFDEICRQLGRITGTEIKGRRFLDITLIGAGPGGDKSITMEAWDVIKKSDYIFGSKRLISGLSGLDITKKKIHTGYLSKDMIPILDKLNRPGRMEVSVLFSGDTGFYSGAGRLYQDLIKWKQEQEFDVSVKIIPGISSVSYFAAACGINWQDARLISIHGKTAENYSAEIIFSVKYNERVLLLVSGAGDVRMVGRLLSDNGLGDCIITVGYQLSYSTEKITEYLPAELERVSEEGLYILLITNKKPGAFCPAPCHKDGDFIRGNVPMTKEEIRELAICKLRMAKGVVAYDIGSGTGSVAVEMAERCQRVYAIEQKEDAIHLIEQNKARFGLENIEVIQGVAPDCLHGLPAPHCAFIGGSGGRLGEIVKNLYEKNPAMRVVVTAVSLETVGEITTLLKGLPISDKEMIQVQISRSREKGNHNLMQADNPVYICSFTFGSNGED